VAGEEGVVAGIEVGGLEREKEREGDGEMSKR
jgi:hypothetical protein